MDEIFQIIESTAFEARLGIASGFTLFEKILKDEPAIQVLLEVPAEKIHFVHSRLLSLVVKEYNNRIYSNPYDTAMAAYLWVLSKRDPKLARDVIEYILPMRDLWWSMLLTKHLAKEYDITIPKSTEGPNPELPVPEKVMTNESIYPKGKIIRLTKEDRLAMEADCPYCQTHQTILTRTAGSHSQGLRPVGTLIRCSHCSLVWRITININNISLPDQLEEARKMAQAGWRRDRNCAY
jgi:hypothetical protein